MSNSCQTLRADADNQILIKVLLQFIIELKLIALSPSLSLRGTEDRD